MSKFIKIAQNFRHLNAGMSHKFVTDRCGYAVADTRSQKRTGTCAHVNEI